MTGFVIQWEGLYGLVIPVGEEAAPHPYQPQREFDTEAEALDHLIGDLDAMIDEIRSARRTAAKRLRKLRKDQQ